MNGCKVLYGIVNPMFAIPSQPTSRWSSQMFRGHQWNLRDPDTKQTKNGLFFMPYK